MSIAQFVSNYESYNVLKVNAPTSDELSDRPFTVGTLFFMSKVVDITGQKFGRLFIVSFSHVKSRKAYFNCLCDCGQSKIIAGGDIKGGNTKSCGCLAMEHSRALKKVNTTHGESGLGVTREYTTWMRILARCYNSSVPRYEDYGGRGITVCDRWRDSYENFLADMGRKPSPRHSIDRRDNEKGYSPDNCRWATPKEQANNRRSSRTITHNGETLTLQQWADKLGLKRSILKQRLYNGWSEEKTITTPPMH